jgi:hypothetical protein
MHLIKGIFQMSNTRTDAASAGAPARRLLLPAVLLSAAAIAAGAEDRATGARIVVGPNLRASANTDSGGRNECWITASPTKPTFLVGVSQTSVGGSLTAGPRQCATTISRNGGQTWREIGLPKQEQGCFDPMAVSASDGRVYVMQAQLGQNFGVGGLGVSVERREGTIRIYSTTDEGKTWSGPAEMHCPVPPDHPRMTVDRSGGPHDGRLYIVWNEVSDTFLKKKYHLFMHTSDDGGKTFSDPILLVTDEGGKLVAAEPVVLSDGTLLATYYQYFWPLSDPKNDRQPFYLLRSTDGGETFGKPEKIAEVASSAWRHLRKDFGRAFTLPIVVADTSPSSPYRDRVYMVWDDVRGGDSNIWLQRSADKGRTWSAPTRINDNEKAPPGGPPDFRMTPVVAVNPAGVVGIAWYDRRNDPTHRCWEHFFTASLDGGETFLSNTPISTARSCPDKGLPPSVYVFNTSPDFEDTLPTQDELKGDDENFQLRMMEETLGIRRALKEAARDVDEARIRVAFDAGRNVWPGHYTGLTSDADGVFHALWADRRSDLQQLFTARVEVLKAPEKDAPPTRETDVTKLVQLVGGPAKYDEAGGTANFELQVRNVSDRAIHAPLKVRVTGIASTPEGPTAAFVDPDEGGAGGSGETAGGEKAEKPTAGVGAAWDFSDALGTRRRLAPLEISEARMITIKTRPETGLDGVFDFEVTGGVEGPSEAKTAAPRKDE